MLADILEVYFLRGRGNHWVVLATRLPKVRAVGGFRAVVVFMVAPHLVRSVICVCGCLCINLKLLLVGLVAIIRLDIRFDP